MRKIILILLTFSLASEVTSQSPEATVNDILTLTIGIRKAKNVSDPTLRALLAKQYTSLYESINIKNKSIESDLLSLSYYASKGLLQQELFNANEGLSSNEIQALADSTFNQFLGHAATPSSKQLRKSSYMRPVAVRSVSLSKNGNSMTSAGGDGRLLGWDVETRSFDQIYQSAAVDRVVNISADERWLALGTHRDEIDLLDLQNPKTEPSRIQSHRGAIYDLEFLPDGSGFISVGADREILKTGIINYEVEEIVLVTSRVQSISISPDGITLAAGATRGGVYLFDLSTPAGVENQKNINRRNQETRPVIDLSFSPDGKYLAIGGYDQENNDQGYVVIWDLENERQYGPDLTGFLSRVNQIKFSPNGELIAASSHDETVRAWDMHKSHIYELPIILDDHSNWVWDLAFSPDSKSIYTSSADGLIRKFDLDFKAYIDPVCNKVTRNLSELEWRSFFNNLSYEETFPRKPIPNSED